VKLITLLLLIGVLGVNGWADEAKPEPYSPELVKKAEAGDPYAQFNLGNAYYKGNGVPQDYKEAVKWYTKSAEQGFADAQCNLASCYHKGEGVSQDIEEAVKWWKKAAEQRYGY
jgi:TPR repeat protein